MGGEQPTDQFLVERLGKTKVGNGGRQAFGFKQIGRFFRLFEARAERQDGDRLALPDDAALADLQRLRDGGQREAAAIAARIAHRDRAAVVDSHEMKGGLI